MAEPDVDPVASAVWYLVREQLGPIEQSMALLEQQSAQLGDHHKALIDAVAASMARREAVVDALHVELREAREKIAVLETRAPVPGPPGADGLGFDDLAVDYDGERTITIKAIRGAIVRDLAVLALPVMIHRGPWEAGRAYVRGDVVSYAGGSWHCQKATDAARPETTEGAACWRLIVKRGDKGKDAR